MSKYIPTIPIRDLTEVTFCEVIKPKNLTKKLKRACKNGNNYQDKYEIVFATDNGQMKIYTTIWMVGKEFILLKENIYIPIKSIIALT